MKALPYLITMALGATACILLGWQLFVGLCLFNLFTDMTKFMFEKYNLSM